MRASSLSNAKVIDLLNGYFVPVYQRNQDFADDGTAPPQEREERDRIYRAAIEAGLPAGTVCVYLLAPTGEPLDTAPLNRPEATDPAQMAEKLERVIRRLNVPKGEPMVRPGPLSAQRAAAHAGADSLVLHLTARYLERRGEELVRLNAQSVLGSQKAGNWGDLPSEAWIALDRSEWTKLLPASTSPAGRNLRVGASWEFENAVAAKLWNHFFPPTENTDLAKNRIDEQSLLARVESIDNGVVRAHLEGQLRMKHPFYHKDDNNFVNATVAGYLDFGIAPYHIRSLRMVTVQATYGGDTNGSQAFGVAVRSVPSTHP